MQTLILGSRNHKEKDIENEGPRRRFSIGADHAIQFSTPRKLSHAESSFFKDKFVEQQCQSIKFKCNCVKRVIILIFFSRKNQ
jgi:hypothetical protein